MTTANRSPKIRSFTDLEVYQLAYRSSLDVVRDILPSLPKCEQNDLSDQLRRSSKAIPRLIAEGYSKKHQRRGFQKYLDDALAKSNETIVSMSHVRDLYAKGETTAYCDRLIGSYESISRMLYALRKAWDQFGKQNEPGEGP
jgi:four helix bundle protein